MTGIERLEKMRCALAEIVGILSRLFLTVRPWFKTQDLHRPMVSFCDNFHHNLSLGSLRCHEVIDAFTDFTAAFADFLPALPTPRHNMLFAATVAS